MIGTGEIRNAADESLDLKWWKPVGDLKLRGVSGRLRYKGLKHVQQF